MVCVEDGLEELGVGGQLWESERGARSGPMVLPLGIHLKMKSMS